MLGHAERLDIDALSAAHRRRPRRHAGAHRRRLDRRAVRRHARRQAPARASSTCRARKGEMEVERALGRHGGAQRRRPASVPFFVGAGAYRIMCRRRVDHLIQRSEFLTTYTPYQPEIAQGTLQYLFEFQTQVARLTGMEVANASMYDGSTAGGRGRADGAPRHAAAARRCSRAACIRTIARSSRTLSRMAGDDVVDAAARRRRRARTSSPRIDDETVLRRRAVPRRLRHICATSTPIAEAATPTGALLIAVVHRGRVARAASKPPGAMGADIVVGEGQSIGNALQLRRALCRPVRHARRSSCARCRAASCGETVDAEGQRGFVLTLSTREQHIRREKATSNICTNSGPLRARLHHPHDAARRGRADAAGARSTTPMRVQLADALAQVPGVEVLNDALLQRVHDARCRGHARRRGRGAGRQGRPRRRAGVAPAARTAGARRPARSSPRPRSTRDDDRAAYRRRR